MPSDSTRFGARPDTRNPNDSPNHPGSNLDHADLDHADLEHADLEHANEGVGWRGRLSRLRAHLLRQRERIRRRAALNTTYRVALGVFGVLVLLIGFVLIPYPGPGWLVVFAGLGVLATEFSVARRISTFASRQYQRWTSWLGRQHASVKFVVAALSGLIVLGTLWVLGVFGMVGEWLGLHWPWLASPLFGG